METTKSPVNAAARNLLVDTEKLGRDIGGIANDAAGLLKDYSAQKIDSAKATLSHAQTVVSDRANRYARLTDGYVRDSPWTALGLAAAAGLLLGALLARR